MWKTLGFWGAEASKLLTDYERTPLQSFHEHPQPMTAQEVDRAWH